jgi:hypothetical protein
VDDLVKGVHTRVGSTRADDDGLLAKAQRGRQGRAQETHDGVVLWLVGETAEGLAVVGQVEAPALRGA